MIFSIISLITWSLILGLHISSFCQDLFTLNGIFSTKEKRKEHIGEFAIEIITIIFVITVIILTAYPLFLI